MAKKAKPAERGPSKSTREQKAEEKASAKRTKTAKKPSRRGK